MIDDLRHLPRQDDPFCLIPPDLAVLLICAIGVLLLLFWPEFSATYGACK